MSADHADWREVEGEIVVFDNATAEYFNLNPAGEMLWRELSAGTTRAALIARILSAFEVDEEHATRDVDAFLEEMKSRGLLDE